MDYEMKYRILKNVIQANINKAHEDTKSEDALIKGIAHAKRGLLNYILDRHDEIIKEHSKEAKGG